MPNIKNTYKTISNCLNKTVHSFSLTEKLIFGVASLALIISGLSILNKAGSYFMTAVPAHGGTFTEGLVGSPRFINPLLELSDADRDLTYLIYSGLMRTTPSGDLIPDLAESYNISPDGLTYNFKLKDDIYFHDGTKVTTDDIEFTVNLTQNTALRSPKRLSWAGVEVQKINDREISFQLKQPYSPFLENTTLGILPKHIWQSASIDDLPFSPYNNIEAIGSGPYLIKKINKNGSGIPISYEMKAFSNYSLGEPYISEIKFNFYPNEKALTEAYLTGAIDSTSALSPQNSEALKKTANNNEEKISLPRVFGVFFNQNQQKVFLNKEVRTALNITVDKDRIVREVLGGYGEKINSPLPNNILPTDPDKEMVYNKDQALNSAKEILSKAGWKLNPTSKIWEKKISKTETQQLAFSISTANTPDLKKTADILKEDWTALGANVTIETFDSSDLNQTIISQRKYDALLFGEIVGRSLDLFAFWHSSQRNTGYNVALYTNSKTDKLLEEARAISDKDLRMKKYSLFQTEIKNDIPAIFIYSPEFIYLLPSKIKGFQSGLINNRSERFENIYNWYIETDKVWNFLVK